MSGVDQPSETLLASARELLDQSDIADIRPTRIQGELLVEGPSQVASVNFSPTLELAFGKGAFRNRFTYSFALEGVEQRVASMEFVIVIEWVVQSEFEPTQDAAEFVASTTGYFAAFPYARELAQSMTTRLGLDPTVLGVLNRNDLRPGTIHVVNRPSAMVATGSLASGADE